eukprot:scaffold141244_cov133-Phaeocystis_antarctica.AAC.2
MSFSHSSSTCSDRRRSSSAAASRAVCASDKGDVTIATIGERASNNPMLMRKAYCCCTRCQVLAVPPPALAKWYVVSPGKNLQVWGVGDNERTLTLFAA